MAQSSINRVPNLSTAAMEAGAECLQLLDRHKLRVQGAAWVYSNSLGEWRFYIVTSLVEIDGPLATYQRIEKLFGLTFNNKNLLIDDVHLGSPNETLFRALAQAFSKPAQKKGLKATTVTIEQITINGFFIEKALIYRLNRSPPKIEVMRNRKAFDHHLKELMSAAN
jgi:hypothetical protein